MFTGLVEMTARLLGASGEHLQLRPLKPFRDPVFGESVAVNGCCLTLERELACGGLEFFMLAETRKRTNIGGLAPGALLNLERALKAGDRLGGHIVSGHIDATGEVLSFGKTADGDYELKVSLPELLAPELVPKGSIAIDGVSLTVVDVERDFFTVRLIPVTRGETALAERVPGSPVNLEGDILGKYVKRQLELRMGAGPKKSDITMDTLREAGFL